MIIYNKNWMKNLKPLSSCLKINISILDVLYSIYILLYLFNKNFIEIKNLEIPDF